MLKRLLLDDTEKCLMLQRKIIACKMGGWTGDPSPLAVLYYCGYWGRNWKDGLQVFVYGMRWKEAQISGMQKISKCYDQKPHRRRKNVCLHGTVKQTVQVQVSAWWCFDSLLGWEWMMLPPCPGLHGKEAWNSVLKGEDMDPSKRWLVLRSTRTSFYR